MTRQAIADISSHATMKIRRVERILLVIGLTFLAVWAAARLCRAMGSRAAIARFQADHATSPTDSASASPGPASDSPIDFQLWSVQRISAYEDSLTKKMDAPPLAILRIPKIGLEVPVFNDTDDLTLNRGVGRILGTAQIGQPGNLGIAGHRDGFFRTLRDITAGDVVELVRPEHTDRYAVSGIRIVSPEDTYVLDPTSIPTLTLVTCFPFYFVGHAPKRYIVTASLENMLESDLGAGQESISEARGLEIRRKKDDLNQVVKNDLAWPAGWGRSLYRLLRTVGSASPNQQDRSTR
jgi:sortase A